MKPETSGFSFRTLQDGLFESEDDPVIFDPSAYPVYPSEMANLDRNELASVDLSTISRVGQDIVNIGILQPETLRQTLRAIFPAYQTRDNKSESWFIDLWDSNHDTNALSDSLGQEDLAKYFSWISENPNVGSPVLNAQEIREGQETQNQPRRSHFCNLIKLESLLNQPPVEVLAEFFELPDDFEISRRHDRGNCQIFSNRDGNKVLKLYIIQTPFYSKGFWSLLLYCMSDSNEPEASTKLSGVIQADADVRLDSIFSDVRELIGRHGHHQALLPVQLFKSHYEATLAAFNSIQTEVAMVDEEFLRQFQEESRLDESSKMYRGLSMTLHRCSMNLAELGRRREFEEKLGTLLQKNLQNDSKLRVVMEIYSRMSQSRDSDIESLPGKIESQRNVLFNLITQHDSYLQARLARESLRDSKAMKTLSILTILFLPGAFIATVFSTNMFDFKKKNSQVRIYFAIAIPLTAVLMICWILWLKNTPQRGDEESGHQYRSLKAMNWLKGGRED
ncbi:hypothetical protein FBEOM_10384 [Fusarium beomiforme]|uniref:Uncharacterized protein n=1 Tax=Fusarium beomiforme TaxID=44412 RepID=A0A9P5ABY0_9HYPO|nr:hypothetical protein FBEOM_10384 [Fusarium beomiforme]